MSVLSKESLFVSFQKPFLNYLIIQTECFRVKNSVLKMHTQIYRFFTILHRARPNSTNRNPKLLDLILTSFIGLGKRPMSLGLDTVLICYFRVPRYEVSVNVLMSFIYFFSFPPSQRLFGTK